MADPGVGRHDAEVVESGLAPAQEGVALAVARELELGVALERQPLGEHVDLDRVVDHQLDRHERVDPRRIAAQVVHGVAHRGEVDDRGDAGEVLHQHARRACRRSRRRARRRRPSSPPRAPRRPRRGGAGSPAAPSASTAAGRRRSRAWSGVDGGRSRTTRRRLRACGRSISRPRHYPACTTWPAWSICTRPTPTAPARCRRSPGRGGAPGADVVLLTDHDTLAAKRNGEEGWYGDVLLLVGEEVSPRRRNHYLAFGLDEEIDHTQLDAAGICAAVRAAGGFGFAAHPFSRGSERFKRAGPGMPFDALDRAVDGIELWSFVNDTGESVSSVARDAALRGRAGPRARRTRPSATCGRGTSSAASRRVVAIGGLDAHQFGKRMGPCRAAADHGLPPLVSLHPHARALRACADGASSNTTASRSTRRCGPGAATSPSTRSPRPRLSLRGRRRADGRRGARGAAPAESRAPRSTPSCACCATGARSPPADGRSLEAEVEEPAVYRVEALRRSKGRERTWILSNPIYLRNGST